MDVRPHLSSGIADKKIAITGSKSETNRLLLLNALYPALNIYNASESDDSIVMRQALAGDEDLIDVHHTGTAMRFLTAYYSLQEGREILLTGSERMKERPIGILADALNALGAEIAYAEKEGFPPLKIKGKSIEGGKVSLRGDVSSQYISALMLIGGKLRNGLEIEIEGRITSKPYIEMTAALLNKAGVPTKIAGNTILVKATDAIAETDIKVESDWSSASYYYSIIALSAPGTRITLSNYLQHSLQGDSVLPAIYASMGVVTTYSGDTIILERKGSVADRLQLDLNDTPDIAQTIAVTCAGLGIECTLTGLHTLKIKETDRLIAMQKELAKLGVHAKITHDSLSIHARGALVEEAEIETYNDHRMAMAFAPIAVKVPIIIKDAGVVSKSYPAFWEDMRLIGFDVMPC
jgi:3-phosphoshikimate 1-carboxyvinyltransferase